MDAGVTSTNIESRTGVDLLNPLRRVNPDAEPSDSIEGIVKGHVVGDVTQVYWMKSYSQRVKA